MKKLLLCLYLALPLHVIAQKNYCKDIETDNDDLRQSTKILSPILEPVCFYKVKDKQHTVTYIALKATGSTYNLQAKGVLLLFKDGSRWEKPEVEATAKVKSLGTYQYTAMVELSDEDLKMFSERAILKYGIYIYDGKLSEKEGVKYQAYASCIKDM
jgi:hypothetical protein